MSMKIKYEFAISEVAGETVAVSVGAGERNMVVSLNGSAELLFRLLIEGADTDKLVTALTETYEGLDEATAHADVEEFVQALRSKELLEE
jgi:hypothetical protein